MAGGEKAKSSGEYGEKIVANLLNLIGWKNLSNGVSVDCIHVEKHSKDGKKSTKHGIDFVFQYKSPLLDSTRQDVLVSVKCRDKYPATEKGIRSKFKEFYDDLVNAAECYPSSAEFKRTIKNTKKKLKNGIIFWIDRERADGKQYSSITEELFNIRLQECPLQSISLVDNARAQFLYDAITFVNKNYQGEKIEFFYIDTGLNNASFEKLYSGEILPVEYINADILPFSVSNSESEKLVLVVKDKFDKDYLKRLIGLSQELTRTWANEVIIAFSDYNEFEHEKLFVEAKIEFDDSNFTKKIKLVSYLPDFRDEVY